MANRRFTWDMLMGTNILIIITAQGGPQSSGNSMGPSVLLHSKLKYLPMGRKRWIFCARNSFSTVNHACAF